jgi:tRNA (guanine-N7-)-methyltransferase
MTPRVRNHVNPLANLKECSFSGFTNENSIIIDVGACRGEFIDSLSKKFPEKNFILFEIRVPLANSLREKFSSMSNIVVFDGDAGRNFESILRPFSQKIETIYINFPDPWSKKKHKKRRFLNEYFLSQISEWIIPQTEFIFQTDQEYFFKETLEIIQKSSFSNIQFFDTSPYGIQTDWEKAKMREEKNIWRIRFRKTLSK